MRKPVSPGERLCLTLRYLATVDVYPGVVNTLSIKRKYGTVYTCDFHLELYPFDIQECSIKLRITSASKSFLLFDTNNSTVKYAGEGILREYMVGKLEMIHDASGTFSEVRVRVPLMRLYGYAILNIYVPTLVLLVVSYVTLFFRASIFDVRMMGSLTVQLVIATLFSQVSESLPKTSYFKMVDVWLIFCIGITFMVIIFHAIIDALLYQSASVTAISNTKGWMESKGKSLSETSIYTEIGKRMVLIAKVVTLTFFVVFNMGYWMYIIA